jgi:hypothetical protein
MGYTRTPTRFGALVRQAGGPWFEPNTPTQRIRSECAAGAFADMHLEIHELIAHDDKVVARFTNGGTNVGPFLNNPPADKHADWLRHRHLHRPGLDSSRRSEGFKKPLLTPTG